MKTCAVLLVLFLLLLVPCEKITYARSEIDSVFVSGEMLSVDVNQITLRKFLGMITEKTGIKFKLDSALAEDKISFTFKDVPIAVVIKRITTHYNSITLYNGNGMVKSVTILKKLTTKQTITGKNHIVNVSTFFNEGSRLNIDDNRVQMENYVDIKPPGWKNTAGDKPPEENDRLCSVSNLDEDGPPGWMKDSGKDGPPLDIR